MKPVVKYLPVRACISFRQLASQCHVCSISASLPDFLICHPVTCKGEIFIIHTYLAGFLGDAVTRPMDATC